MTSDEQKQPESQIDFLLITNPSSPIAGFLRLLGMTGCKTFQRLLRSSRFGEAGDSFSFVLVSIKNGQKLGDLQQVADSLREMQKL